MAISVDTSVLLDVLLKDERFGEASERSLVKAANKEGLIICETALAEIIPVLSGNSVTEFLNDWNIVFQPSSLESASLAGKMFNTYLERGGKRGRVVPDFLIGAHAQLLASGILARDRGYFRDYFENLRVIEPTPAEKI